MRLRETWAESVESAARIYALNAAIRGVVGRVGLREAAVDAARIYA